MPPILNVPDNYQKPETIVTRLKKGSGRDKTKNRIADRFAGSYNKPKKMQCHLIVNHFQEGC